MRRFTSKVLTNPRPNLRSSAQCSSLYSTPTIYQQTHGATDNATSILLLSTSTSSSSIPLLLTRTYSTNRNLPPDLYLDPSTTPLKPGSLHPLGRNFPGRELTLSKTERAARDAAHNRHLRKPDGDIDAFISRSLDDFEEEDVLDEFQQPIHYDPELVSRDEAIEQYKKMMELLEKRREEENLPEETLKELVRPMETKEMKEVVRPVETKEMKEVRPMETKETKEVVRPMETKETKQAVRPSITKAPLRMPVSDAKKVTFKERRQEWKERRWQPRVVKLGEQAEGGDSAPVEKPFERKMFVRTEKKPKEEQISTEDEAAKVQQTQKVETESPVVVVKEPTTEEQIPVPAEEKPQEDTTKKQYSVTKPGPLCTALGKHFGYKIGVIENLASKIGMSQFKMIEKLGMTGETNHLRTLVKAMVEGQNETEWVQDDGILGGQRPKHTESTEESTSATIDKAAAQISRKSAEVMRGVARLIMSDNLLAWEYAKQIIAYLQSMGLLPDSIYESNNNARLGAVNNEIFVMVTDSVWSIAEKVQKMKKNGKLESPVAKNLDFDIHARTVAMELLMAACVEKGEAKSALLLADDILSAGWEFADYGSETPTATKKLSEDWTKGPPHISELIEIRPRVIPSKYEALAMKILQDRQHLKDTAVLSLYLQRKQNRGAVMEQPEKNARKELTVWMGRLPSYYRSGLQAQILSRLSRTTEISGPKTRAELKLWTEELQALADAEAFVDLKKSLGSFEHWHRTIFLPTTSTGMALELDPYFRASMLDALSTMGINGRFGDFLFLGSPPVFDLKDIGPDESHHELQRSILRFTRFRNRLPFAHDVVQYFLFDLYRSEIEARPCMAIPNAIKDELMDLALHFGMGNLVQDLLFELRLSNIPLQRPENLLAAAYKVMLIKPKKTKGADLGWELPAAQNLIKGKITKTKFRSIPTSAKKVWYKLLDVALQYNDRTIVEMIVDKKLRLPGGLDVIPEDAPQALQEPLILNMIRNDRQDLVEAAVANLPPCPDARYDRVRRSKRLPRGHTLVSERLASAVFAYILRLQFLGIEFNPSTRQWARNWLLYYYSWTSMDFKRLSSRTALQTSIPPSISETVAFLTPAHIPRSNPKFSPYYHMSLEELEDKQLEDKELENKGLEDGEPEDKKPKDKEPEASETAPAPTPAPPSPIDDYLLDRPASGPPSRSAHDHLPFFEHSFRLHRLPQWWARSLLLGSSQTPALHRAILASKPHHRRQSVQEVYSALAKQAKEKQKEEQRQIRYKVVIRREQTDEEDPQPNAGVEALKKKYVNKYKLEAERREREGKESLLRFLDSVLPV